MATGFEAITFDCYGTLVDWEAGILRALTPLLSRHGLERSPAEVLSSYAVLESEIEAERYRSYREVLREVVARLGARSGFDPSPEECRLLERQLPGWPLFDDTADALARLAWDYPLGVLSNIDDDLWERTAERFPVKFNWVVTAQQVRSYKPALAHFREFSKRSGIPASRTLHAAQSLFHDIRPAGRLGVRTAWINRRAGRAGTGATPPAEARPDGEVPDLKTLIERLV